MSPEPESFESPSSQPPLTWLARANRQALAAHLLTAAVHDANNSLQVVSGAAEVLAMDPTPAAVAKRTASIVDQALHATAVLRALAEFVKAPADMATEVDLKHLAGQGLALRQYTLRRLRVDARVDGQAAVCVGSPRGLMQVLLNLCVNAERAVAGRDAPTLRMVASCDGDVASLRVIDNGAGVPEAVGRRMFEWPPGASRAADGLGIGLAVSSALLALDGGRLHYAPAAGGGAVFTMQLPRPVPR